MWLYYFFCEFVSFCYEAISERIFVIANIIIDRTVCRKHATDEQFDALKIYILYAIFNINLLSIFRSIAIAWCRSTVSSLRTSAYFGRIKKQYNTLLHFWLNLIYERMLRSSSIHKLCALHKCIRPEIFEAKNLCSHYACECVCVCVRLHNWIFARIKRPIILWSENALIYWVLLCVVFDVKFFFSRVYWSVGILVPHHIEYVLGRFWWLWLPIDVSIQSQAPMNNGYKSRTEEMHTDRIIFSACSNAKTIQ